MSIEDFFAKVFANLMVTVLTRGIEKVWKDGGSEVAAAIWNRATNDGPWHAVLSAFSSILSLCRAPSIAAQLFAAVISITSTFTIVVAMGAPIVLHLPHDGIAGGIYYGILYDVLWIAVEFISGATSLPVAVLSVKTGRYFGWIVAGLVAVPTSIVGLMAYLIFIGISVHHMAIVPPSTGSALPWVLASSFVVRAVREKLFASDAFMRAGRNASIGIVAAIVPDLGITRERYGR
jgi:hypothetical protein